MFDTAQSLKMHLKTHHRLEQKTVQCSDCPKSFTQKYLLERHIRQVHEKKLDLVVPERDLMVSEEVEIITGENYVDEENGENEDENGHLVKTEPSSSDVVPEAGQVVVKFKVR